MTDRKSIQPSRKLTGISCNSWKKKTEKRSVQAGLRMTRTKADRALKRRRRRGGREEEDSGEVI